MLFKKTAEHYQYGNVQAVNGKISYQKIQLNVFCYVVDGVLIDTGAKALFKQFKTFLDSADVDLAVITHFHEDHTGCAAYVQKTKQIPLYMNEMTIAECKQKADYPMYRKLFWGVRPAFQAQPISERFQSRNATWDVILTPGHAKDHLSFLNRETGQLFTGDLYVTPKTKLVLREESIPTIIDSLQRVLTYDFQEVYCQHAGQVINGREAIQSKLDYLQSLQQKVLDLHATGFTPQAIHDELFKRTYQITKVSGGEWDSKHIVNSILQG